MTTTELRLHVGERANDACDICDGASAFAVSRTKHCRHDDVDCIVVPLVLCTECAGVLSDELALVLMIRAALDRGGAS